MLNKFKIYFFCFIFFSLVFHTMIYGQTTQWRVIWDRNPDIDSVAYYVVYRKVNAAPTGSDSIGFQNQTAGASIDSVVYQDKNLTKGRRYVYSVVAVDSMGKRSGFSNTDDAAIPEITFSTLRLPADATSTVDLKSAQYVNDPDNSFDQMKWTVNGGNQITISINSSTNIATITTPADTTVIEQIEFVVSDPDGFIDKRQITISLAGVSQNSPPVFTSLPDTAALSGSTYKYTATATDPDGDVLRFFLQSGPLFLEVQKLTDTSALLTGTPDSSDVGTYNIILAVTDEIAIDTQSFMLIVKSTEAPKLSDEIKPYPMPFKASEYSEMRFTNLPEGGTIFIFNLIGDLVFKSENISPDFAWGVLNDAGKRVNAGLYIYYVNDHSGSRVGSGKLVVVR